MEFSLKLIVLFGLILGSCSNSSNREITHKSLPVDITLKVDTPKNDLLNIATSLSNMDTLTLYRQVAVLSEPDSIRIEKRKKEIGEEDFYTGADDYIYYLNTAHEFLDSVKLAFIETTDRKFLKFVYRDKTYQVINPDRLPELWNVYFFDPSKKAKLVDLKVFEEEYKSYFK